MWERIETFIFVSIITALVWLYAEGENVRSHDLDVAVKPVAVAADDLMIAPSTPHKVRLTVRASQSQLTRLKELTREPLELAVQADPDNVVQTFDLKQWLSSSPTLLDAGVNLIDAEPQKLSLQIEAMDTVEADVRVISPPGVQLAPGVTVEPAKVRVRLPRRFVTGLATQGIEARPESSDFEGLEENVAHTIEAPLSLPPSLAAVKATIDRPMARVTFTIRKATDSHVVSAVPIYVVISPILLQRFDVTVPTEQLFVRDVKLSGPSDVIRRIREGRTPITAELRLSADDLERGVASAVPYIEVPPGVQIESTVPRIPITVKPRLEP